MIKIVLLMHLSFLYKSCRIWYRRKYLPSGISKR